MLGICHLAFVFLQAFQGSGGAGPQKRKVAISQLKVMDNDPAPIVSIFSVSTFVADDFLEQLKNEGKIQGYLDALEKTKLVASYVQVTVDHITAMTMLKVCNC